MRLGWVSRLKSNQESESSFVRSVEETVLQPLPVEDSLCWNWIFH
jgi:hypothetical protein